MLASSLAQLHARLAPDDVVLDVGGWANPLPRADWVMDLFPYETRGLYARNGWPTHGAGEAERFSDATWIQRDVCAREPFPFADDAIDFVVCSHTLEDVRDPVWVCSEMTRVGRAGYVEVPSRREEQALGVEGPYAGRGHHRWLIDVRPDGLEFTAKPDHRLAMPGHHFPPSYHRALAAERRVEQLWWHRELRADERIFVESAPLDADLARYVTSELDEPRRPRTGGRTAWRRLRRTR